MEKTFKSVKKLFEKNKENTVAFVFAGLSMDEDGNYKSYGRITDNSKYIEIALSGLPKRALINALNIKIKHEE